jgi:hypothetical protein
MTERKRCLNCKCEIEFGKFCVDCVRGWVIGIGTALVVNWVLRKFK